MHKRECIKWMRMRCRMACEPRKEGSCGFDRFEPYLCAIRADVNCFCVLMIKRRLLRSMTGEEAANNGVRCT